VVVLSKEGRVTPMSMSTLGDRPQSTTGVPVSQALAVRSRRRPVPWGQVVLHVILICLALAAVLPLVWCVFASFKYFKELVSSTDLLPHVWTLHSYQGVFGLSNLWSGFRNTVIVTFSVTVATIFTSTLEGYVFSKFDFPGKNVLFVALLATMMIPFAVIMIPLYLTISGMGLNNQLAGVIVTGLFSTFGIFMMRQFMFNVPSELIDSGRIDGASEWRIFFQIVVPLSFSPMAALGIFTFLGVWNDFLWPSIVLTTQDRETLPLVVAGLQGYFWQQFDYLIAAAVVTVIPLMIAYLFGSKYMIQGIAMTGLKM
jgi:ABC-type glycerol-3-phosphate transport system permease component